jgi:hypothetical protein
MDSYDARFLPRCPIAHIFCLERYENLQVRMCGWNVRRNDLPRVQQDAYILRADSVAR